MNAIVDKEETEATVDDGASDATETEADAFVAKAETTVVAEE